MGVPIGFYPSDREEPKLLRGAPVLEVGSNKVFGVGNAVKNHDMTRWAWYTADKIDGKVEHKAFFKA